MADEQTIRVVITGVASDLRRALDGAKGDLGGLKAAIKDVPNQVKVDVQAQTEAATERLRVLRDMAKDVPNRINIEADADTGVAEAKLRLLQSQARDTENAIARAQLGIGGGGGGATLLSRLGSGGLPGAGPLALGAGVAPFVAAGAGSATAIAGSAGAAALGAGALGTAGLGTIAAGLGPLAALSGGLNDAIKLSEQLKTAQDNLSAAQQQFGAKSTQAATAQKELNKVLLAADPALRPVAEQLVKVHDTLNAAEQKVLPAYVSALKPVLATFTNLLPTIEQMARIDLGGISRGIKPLLDFVNSSTFKDALVQLSDTFAKLAGPLGQAFTNLFHAFLNVAVAASPFLVQIANAFQSWSQSFLASLSPGQHLNDLIKGLVGQLHSWFDLAVSLGKLMVTVFSAGASTGKSLVDQLTQLVNKWNAWLNTKQGQEDLRKFFSDSANLLRQVLSALAPVAQLIGSMSIGLIPAMTTLLKPLAELLSTISGWVNSLSKGLPPVLNALPGLAVAVGVLASWKALQAVVTTIAAKIASGITGKVGGAAAGAEGGAAAGAGGGIAGAEVGGVAAGALGAGAIGVLPIAGAALAGFVALTKLNQVIHGDDGVSANLDKLKKAMAGALSSGNAEQMQKLGDQAVDFGHKLQDLGIKGADQFVKLGRSAQDTADKLDRSFGQMLSGQMSKVQPFFRDTAAQAGKSMADIQLSVKIASATIPELLGKGTQAGEQALAHNFLLAVGDIQKSMADGVISTSKGISAIEDLLTKALKALGSPVKLSDVKAIGIQSAQQLIGFTQTGSADQSQPGIGHRAGGGLIQVGEPGEKGHDTVPLNVGGTPIKVGAGEQVAVFNHEQQQVMNSRLRDMGGLPGMFSSHNRPHHMAQGGMVPGYSVGGAISGAADPYVFPIPGFSIGRTDMGVDASAAPGTPIGAIGDSRLVDVVQNWFAGQPLLDFELLSGPDAGRFWYLAEQIVPTTESIGSTFKAGQAVARFAGSGTGIEIGWAGNASGQTLAQTTTGYHEGQITPAGVDFRNFIAGLAHGQITGGGAFGPGLGGLAPQWTDIKAPKWTGPGGAVGAIGQAAVAKVLAAANQFGQAHMPAGTGGVGSVPSGVSGPVPKQIFEALTQLGWNKVAIAGAIGNAVQESSLQPGISGGGAAGLWQWTPGSHLFGPAAAAHQPWQSVAFQSALMSRTIGGPGRINATTSPGDAAVWLEQNFERAGIPAMGNRIAAANQAFGEGFAQGGFATGGVPHVRSSSPQRPSFVDSKGKHHYPKPSKAKPLKLPPFKALPGFDNADMSQIASIDNYVNNQLAPWQGLMSGIHARQPVVPLVTLADGSQVVNWDGMVDPTTGQFVKGIHARLAEIGQLAGSNINTELGIDQKFLDEYGLQGAAAGHAQGMFGPWLKKMQADRQKQLDASNDDQALVDRLTLLKERLPKEKSDRTFSITQRFKKAKDDVRKSSSKTKFSAGALLAAQQHELAKEESDAKNAIGSKAPAGWHGTKKGWEAQRKRELASLTSEFSDRRSALDSTARTHRFQGTVARSAALSGLGFEEDAEKHKLSDVFKDRTLDFTDRLRSTRAWLARDKRLLASDETSLTAATGSADGRTVVPGGGSIEDTLLGLLDPMGPLAINVATKRQIDIPNLLDEISTLLATKPGATAAAAAPDLSAQLALQTTIAQQAQQALAVSRSQFKVFKGFEPLLEGRLLGSFQTGIDRVPQTGPYLLHRDEMVIPDPYGAQGNRAAATVQTAQGPVQIDLHFDKDSAPFIKLVRAELNQHALPITSQHAGQRARLIAGVRRP